MPKKETAEQKLLRIIEDSPREDSSPSASAGNTHAALGSSLEDIAAAVKGPGLAVPASWGTLLGFFQRWTGPASLKSFGLREINHLLILMIGVAVVGLVALYRTETAAQGKQMNLTATAKTSKSAAALDPLPQYQPLESFLDIVLARNIFRPYEKKETPVVSAPTGKEHVALKLQDMKLVGISWLDTPDSASAMIERKDGVTIFLREGEKVNDVLIRKIFADRVIFAFQEQEMEVRL